ncbi:MAG: hypothetical protein EBT45_08885, partial [Alphaproteobacteria bacterium]|nr:hypothetical protein [Alphaproteobacteria bacterium]
QQQAQKKIKKRRKNNSQFIRKLLDDTTEKEKLIEYVNLLLSPIIAPHDHSYLQEVMSRIKESSLLESFLQCLLDIVRRHQEYFVNLPDLEGRVLQWRLRARQKQLQQRRRREQKAVDQLNKALVIRDRRDRGIFTVYNQTRQTPAERENFLSRIEKAISFLQEWSGKLRLSTQSDSKRTVEEMQTALDIARNLLENPTLHYYRRKDKWVSQLKYANIYLHDDDSNTTGFFDNVGNLLTAVEGLNEKDDDEIRKILSRIPPGCIDYKLESIHRFLLSKINVEASFFGTCGLIFSSAMEKLKSKQSRITKVEFVQYLADVDEVIELFDVLNLDTDYRKKAIDELKAILKDTTLVHQELITTTKEERINVLYMIVNALVGLSALDEDDDGNI